MPRRDRSLHKGNKSRGFIALAAVTSFFIGQLPAQSQVLHVLYNGTEIQKEPLKNFPSFMVLIEATQNDGQRSFCTGAALAADVILTAGHCVNETQTVSVKVIRSNNPVKLKTIKAKAWKAHPQLNGGYDGPQLERFTTETTHQFHDIGLIILSEPSSDVEPIMMAPSTFEPAGSGSWMFVFGQGRDKQYRLNGNLEFLELQATEKIGDSSLYVADLKPNQGWCVRDSGGPVTVGADGINGGYQHYLLGVSFAFFDGFQHGNKRKLEEIWGDADVPGCGARVGYSLIGRETAWIEQTLKELLPDQPRPLLYFQ